MSRFYYCIHSFYPGNACPQCKPPSEKDGHDCLAVRADAFKRITSERDSALAKVAELEERKETYHTQWMKAEELHAKMTVYAEQADAVLSEVLSCLEAVYSFTMWNKVWDLKEKIKSMGIK